MRGLDENNRPSGFDEHLWAVTTYFNPAGYRSRWINFKAFRRHLDVSLLVVELAAPGKHELLETDGEIVVRATGNPAIWQKERLLNIAIEKLPAHVDKVAWVDCDIVFDDRSWAIEAVKHLERKGGLLQPFSEVNYLPRLDEDGMHELNLFQDVEPMYRQQSFGKAYASGQLKNWDGLRSLLSPGQMEEGLRPDSVDETRPAPGFSWVALRSDLENMPLYDCCVLGGGDAAMAYAAIGQPDLYERGLMAPKLAAHYFDWATEAGSYFAGNASFLEGGIRHLWHGFLRDRNYRGRNQILVEHDFDPDEDIILDANGCWDWAEPESALSGELKAYFQQRKEDS